MRLLFIALTKHQYRYFKLLEKNLPVEARVLFLPSWRLSLRGFLETFSIDTTRIEALKYQEVKAKYKNRLYQRVYTYFLKMQIPFVISTIYGAIKDYDPKVVVFWNGKKFHQALGVEVAKRLGKKRLFFENGLLPHTTQMDFQGVNASNSLSKKRDFYENLVFDTSCQLPHKLQKRVGKKALKVTNERLPKEYIFVPFQVAYDTQIIHHSPWIGSMYELFALVLELAHKTGEHFVIKEHPSDRVSDYGDLYDKGGAFVHFSSEDTQKLIENAKAVMTINSSVGIEALLFQKRVIVLGEAFFAIEGIVKIASNKRELEAILQTLRKWEVNSRLIENFLKYLQCRYLIPGSWREPDSAHFQAIMQRLRREIGHV